MVAFEHYQVKIENISADNIVDGNGTLILGLIWTIILRFQVQVGGTRGSLSVAMILQGVCIAFRWIGEVVPFPAIL